LDNKNIKYTPEVSIDLGRKLKWDVVCEIDDKIFYIESDGLQHFSLNGMVRVTRNKLDKCHVEKRFKKQQDSDLIKEKYIRDNNKLLFRFSYRQTGKIEELVNEMLEKVKLGVKGVIYMDDIYW